MRIRNPFAFRPLPVTTICTVVYFALVIPLLLVHHIVPQPDLKDAGNLTEAWRDLQVLTDRFHPYNSHQNDEVRDWLLERIGEYSTASETSDSSGQSKVPIAIFSDTSSNVSFSSNGSDSKPGLSVYFEGTNIIVYIRGSQDDTREWWLTGDQPKAKGGVMVNAHYDSVSTGFGATDDGIGVVTVLQLIKHFAQSQPYRGLVALLNNGEEDYLNGARAFSQHAMSAFPHTFLNLEGAGAGGRATLFRSTDTEVTKYYQLSRLPFGTVLSADAFKRGIIRSETDYSFFNGFLKMRGLDVAFYEPRSRYHTEEDDTKHSSRASLDHMMSTAFATVNGLTSDKTLDFESTEESSEDYPNGQGSDAVWFDLFGNSFAVFPLKTLFAISVILLVVGPLSLVGLFVALYKLDKLYIFNYSKQSRWSESSESVGLRGLRGLTRWPIAFILASVAIVGLAFLLTTTNPFIFYSSPYAVWTMMISAWLVVAYVCLSISDSLRPTSLQRVYALLWMFIAAWIVLVLTTMTEQQQKLASGYLMVFNFACIYLATVVALSEHFRLPPTADYADDQLGPQGTQPNVESGSVSSSRPPTGAPDEERTSQTQEQISDDPQDADETTSLLRSTNRTTFKRYSSPHQRTEEAPIAEPSPEDIQNRRRIYGYEQPWSATLPSSLWLLEFLLLTAFPVVLIGQVALLLTSATYQTLSDGNPPLSLYIAVTILTVLLLAPLAPFLHRFTYEIPTFLFLVFIGTLLYNILAFPFSPANRLKLYFIQRVDLDTGTNNVSLGGIGQGPYLLNAVSALPSVAGQTPICHASSTRVDLTECTWSGLHPQVVPDSRVTYKDWLSYNVTRVTSNRSTSLSSSSKPIQAHFSLSGRNTRACKLLFSQPIRDFRVRDGSFDPRFQRVSDPKGSNELRLWSRTWNRRWEIDVWWNEEDGRGDRPLKQRLLNANKPHFDGRVVCLWSDANQLGVIPALDEVKHYAPTWTTVTKAADGLVEGSKAFMV